MHIGIDRIELGQQRLDARPIGEALFEKHGKLDPLTVSLSHPDAVAAMLSGKHEIKSYMATVPFYFQVAADPRVRTVLTSYDVLGGSHTSFAIFNTESWKTKNPKTYEAVAAGFDGLMPTISKTLAWPSGPSA